MSTPIIELAIRSPKRGREAAFLARKRTTVDALLRVRGVGPERAFVATSTLPPFEPLPHVGMTLYADAAAQKRATRNLPFLARLVGFFQTLTMHVGVMLTADDPTFDFTTFGSAPGQVVEFAALTPATGVTEAEFVEARAAFLGALDALEHVERSYTFTTVGGLKAADSLVHVSIYRSADALSQAGAALGASPEFEAFRQRFSATMIAFAVADGESSSGAASSGAASS